MKPKPVMQNIVKIYKNIKNMHVKTEIILNNIEQELELEEGEDEEVKQIRLYKERLKKVIVFIKSLEDDKDNIIEKMNNYIIKINQKQTNPK